MAKGGGRKEGGTTIVLRREEGDGHGHHGGAWKVAYADFVTAMMAFFLLMWLLNATTEEQRRGLADYFNPTNPLARANNGSGLPFGGRTPHESAPMVSNAGALRAERGPRPVLQDIEEDDSETPAQPGLPRRDAPPGPEEQERVADAARLSDAALRAEQERRERQEFTRAAEQLMQAVQEDPALAKLSDQLIIEQVPEGMRIQLLDAERLPMFALGGSAPNERAQALLARVAQVLQRLPNALAIAGHTDATPFRTGTERSNWDLSAERANVTRRLLAEAGIAEARIRSVSGHADREPLLPGQPEAPANRRVAITVLRSAPAGQAP
jgi:chemotaxis protein MotB